MEKDIFASEKIYPEPGILEEVEKDLHVKIQTEAANKVLAGIVDKIHLAEEFIQLIPMYYDDNGIFWMFDNINLYWRMVDDIEIFNWIHNAAYVNIIKSSERTEILNALKQVSRKNKPQELGDKCIQFRKEIVDLSTGDRFLATSKYFCTNPLPWKLSRYTDTPNLDKLFSDWVRPADVPLLYEIIAFCMIRCYFIERIFCLHGSGSNGKSEFRKILRKFLGNNNVSSTSLDTLLNSRFEPAKLHNKLMCEMGETNLSSLENTQLIKRLVSGKDLVGIEYKNKKPFDFINYAKMVISTNNLPPTDDKTDGFYRKWSIIDFPNTFSDDKDVFSQIPDSEYECLATKCLYIADNLLKKRSFSSDGTFEQRREKYESLSNPIEKFIREFVDEEDPDGDIPKWDFEKRLNGWLKDNKIRSFSSIMIAKCMKRKGIQERTLWKEWYENNSATKKQFKCWIGIKWKI